MTTLTIASQLDAPVNQAVRERLAQLHPTIELVEVPTGVPSDLPPQASILFARPINVRGYQAPDTPPPGWPYGLKWIQLISSGLDAYPAWLFDALPVATARGSASDIIAEFVLASVFARNKRLPELWKHDADWHLTELVPVSGQTLGILGFGSIGSRLAQKAQALGMHVVALRQSDAPFEVPGVKAAKDIHELFALSDHLVLAAPLTPATRHIIDASVLASARPGLHLINIARGGLVDQQALLDALDNGQLSLASLDVTEPEPLPDGHPLYTHPRVRLTPHTSAISTNRAEILSGVLLENLERYLRGEGLLNRVR